MVMLGTELMERYFAARAGHKAIKAARAPAKPVPT